ncbi:hypothetical protein [Paraburkholderia dilworthii]|uniref:hypothetical protein n=1 Tax=Paraburkholderia dilworthii TaxID=948106 RepID=UPI0004101D7B|nr:hypothetical protein [Paraburkholderia dilworthii]
MKFSTSDGHFLGDWGVIEINALCDTLKTLKGSLMVAFGEHRDATHYKVIEDEKTGGNMLALYWTKRDDAFPLPFKIDANLAVDFVAQWLEANGKWPKQRPDTDGDCHAGFRIQSGWSQGKSEHCDFYVAALIIPGWTVYGK